MVFWEASELSTNGRGASECCIVLQLWVVSGKSDVGMLAMFDNHAWPTTDMEAELPDNPASSAKQHERHFQCAELPISAL